MMNPYGRTVKRTVSDTLANFHQWIYTDGILYALVELEDGTMDQWIAKQIQFDPPLCKFNLPDTFSP